MAPSPTEEASIEAARRLHEQRLQIDRDRRNWYALIEMHPQLWNQGLHNVVETVRRLRAVAFTDLRLEEDIGPLLSRLPDRNLLQNAAMGCRMMKVMIDIERRDFFVKRDKVEGEIKVNGNMITKDFSMSTDPTLNRARARVGTFFRFWKKEPMKHWNDFDFDYTSREPEPNAPIPILHGCFLGWIAAIGQNSIYFYLCESSEEGGIEAVDSELKICCHLMFPEGSDYKHGPKEGRPIFTRGLNDYQGRMLNTFNFRRIRFDEPMEMIPHARLTEESHVYLSDELPKAYRFKPEKLEDQQFVIPAPDQTWYRDAGCPEPGMLYVKNEVGLLEVKNLTSTSLSPLSASFIITVEDEASLVVSVPSENPATTDTAINTEAESVPGST